ncbi:MAG: hypothetical protein ACREL5_00330, partial [Gemmatimonadales bacterium]
LAIDPAGRLAVGLPADGTIMFLGLDGRHLGMVGRHGAGPGEFLNLARIGANRGGFWASDNQTSRVTLIGSNPRVIGTFPAPTTVRGAARIEFFHPYVVAVAAGDTLLVDATDAAASARSPGLIAMGHGGHVYALTARNGELYRVLARTPPRPQCVVLGRNGSAVAVPLCADALVAPAADASRITLIEFELPGAAYAVTSIRSNGDTVFARRFEVQLQRVSRHVADSISAATIRSLPPTLAGMFQSSVTIPKYYPPIARVFVGADRTTWLETSSEGPFRLWVVLDSLGRNTRRVRLPDSVTLKAADVHHAWGTATDTDGVENLVRFALARSAPNQ